MKEALLVLLLCLSLTFAKSYDQYSYHVGGGPPQFTSVSTPSSREVYNLIETQKDKIFLFAFYINGKDHEKTVEQVENSLAGQKDVFEQVVYSTIRAEDEYQYKGILYDLDIFNEPFLKYPYFLVIKDDNGHLINGPESKDLIRSTIMELAGKGSASSS